MIQNIISRMASNSGLIKRWTIALVPSVAAFGKFGDAPIVAGIAGGVPLIFMWCLDIYYLRLEHGYRKLYEAIVYDKKGVEMFDLNVETYLERIGLASKAMRSKSVLLFYPPLIVALILALATV